MRYQLADLTLQEKGGYRQMYRYEDLILRKFRFEDIPMKIEWINNSKNNVYLGYDLPLDYDKTCQWYERIKNQRDRFDAVVEYMGKPVGLFGLLHIDYKNKKAEDYSLIGDLSLKGKGIGTRAGFLNVLYAFYNLGLNKVYGTIETDNIASITRCRRSGWHVEGYLHEDRWRGGKPIDSYYVAIYKNQFVIPDGIYWEDETSAGYN